MTIIVPVMRTHRQLSIKVLVTRRYTGCSIEEALQHPRYSDSNKLSSHSVEDVLRQRLPLRSVSMKSLVVLLFDTAASAPATRTRN